MSAAISAGSPKMPAPTVVFIAVSASARTPMRR